jgi:hypothetical protein
MPTEAADRRRAARWSPGPSHPALRVRLRAGRELLVVDVSAFGALVEGSTRLLPGTHLDVHVTATHGRMLVRARVERCTVWTLAADEVRYRGALAFGSAVEFPAPDPAPPSDAHARTDAHA